MSEWARIITEVTNQQQATIDLLVTCVSVLGAAVVCLAIATIIQWRLRKI